MESAGLKTSTPIVYQRYDSGFGSYGKGSTDSKGKLVELSPIRKQPVQSNLSAILRVCGIFSPAKKSQLTPVEKVTKKLMFTSSSDSGYGSTDPTDSILLVTEQVQNQNLSKKFTFSTDENCNIIYDCVNSEKLYQPFKYICKEGTDDEEPKSNVCDNNNTSFLGSFCNHDLTDLSTEENELKIDFISELDIRNCTGVLSLIFSCLSGEDLRNASFVNKQWQDAVLSDRRAYEKRKNYIANKKNSSVGPNKENKFQGSPVLERDHKSAFTCVINISSETSMQQKHDSFYGKFDSFLEEVKTITEKECLMKCPKCHYPSKPHGSLKFSCTRKLCLYEFCKKCLGPFLKKHMCSVQEFDITLPSIVIGSKKSKKNLRRL